MKTLLARSSVVALVGLVLCLSEVCQAATEEKAVPKPKYRVLIVRAAGCVPGTKKPTAADAITHATEKAANTYVFTKNLVGKLAALKTQAEIMDFSKCKDFEKLLPVDAVVFAGPTYGNKLPGQLQEFIPKVKAAVNKHPAVVYSCLTSCAKPPSGLKAVNSFTESLKKARARTARGVVLGSKTEEKEWDKKIKEFAASLVKAIQEGKTSGVERHRDAAIKELKQEIRRLKAENAELRRKLEQAQAQGK